MPETQNIYFKDEGKGFPILLIHGFCETHQIWNSFSERLATKFRVLSVDLPGFGRSELLKGSFSIDDVATKIIGWLRSIQIDTCVVIGHSLGGYVALAMVNQDPKGFEAFGLFHSTAYPDSEEKKLSRNKVIEFVTANGVEPFIQSFVPPLFFDQTNPHIPAVVQLGLQTRKETLLSYVAAMRDRPDRTYVIKDFVKPILFIAGDKDGVVSPEALENQSKLSSKPNLVIMKHVAHMGMFENEKLAFENTLAFLQNALPQFV